MKKIFVILILLFGFAVFSGFAWEPNDLTKYPPCMDSNDWIVNFGLGMGTGIFLNLDSDWVYLPTFKLSLDKNVPIGRRNLPFFFGGLIGYTGYGRSDWFNYRIPLGIRAGYHLNWDIKNLDTYVVATAGWVINIATGENNPRSFINPAEDLYLGFNIGARWFFTDFFGVWAEAGYIGDLSVDLGLTFKF